jgi:DNA-binding winged helix-turn-helix (wHTH) protein/TolB-like protein
MDQLTRTFPSRIELAQEPDFSLGPLRVCPSRCEVRAGGERRAVQRRVMQVLVALAHPSAEVVAHDELIRRCWGGISVGEDAIGRCIGQLRRLAAEWDEPPFAIETIPGVGYRLDAPGRASADAGEAAPPPADRLGASRRGRRAWIALAAGAALAAAGAGAAWLWRGPPPTPPARVAVLPFEPLSSGQQDRFLAERISDQVLDVFSANQVEALSRADAAPLRGPDPAGAAARMGVGFLVNGTVTQSGGQAEVTARIDDARTHVTLWAADFHGQANVEGDLPDQVAAKVADLTEIAQFARTFPPTIRDDATLSALLEAHDLIRWNRERSWARLLAVAQRVATDAPDFAFSHSIFAVANAYASNSRDMATQRAALVAATRREAARALALDPHDASAYFALSQIEPDYRSREAVLLKGIAAGRHPAAPLAAVINTEGEVLLSVGRLQEALIYEQRSVAMDPLSAVKNISLIQTYEALGREGDAQDVLRQSEDRWPHHPEVKDERLAFVTFYGDPAEGLAILRDDQARPAELLPVGVEAWRAYLQAMKAPDPVANARARRLVAAAGDARVLPRVTATMMLSRLGAVDAAFAQANAALDAQGVSGLDRKGTLGPLFLFAPPTAALRADPRFMRLAAGFRLTDYWRSTGRWPDFCAGPQARARCIAAAERAGA